MDAKEASTIIFKNLITLIARRIGLSIGDNDRESFQGRILARLKSLGVTDLQSYLGLLSATSPEAATEWQVLVQLFTTGESYFFRDQGQLQIIRNHILPRLLEVRRVQKSLRIWSAGCAAGEEPYSVAMLLHELLPARSGWRIFILGTDINERVLEKAKSGNYTQWSFRMVAPAVRAQYFSRKQDAWELDKKIRNMVTFRRGNLVEDRFPALTSELHSMDLILCRNVFIYFSPETVAMIMEKFAGVLNEGGYLITGHGEVPQPALKWFSTVIIDDHVFYRKITDRDPIPAKAPVMSAPSVPAAGSREPAARLVHRDTGNLPVVDRNKSDPCEVAFLKAQASADAGRYEEAHRDCRALLESTPTFVPAYLLLAQLAEALGNLDEAQETLKKAIFLRHDSIAAYLELGRIYAQKHDARRAEQMYTAARDLLRALPSEAALESYRDVTAGELLRHLEELRG